MNIRPPPACLAALWKKQKKEKEAESYLFSLSLLYELIPKLILFSNNKLLESFFVI